MDDQDWTDADPFRGYPLVATLTGLAVITLTSVFLSRFIALPALAVLLAAGAGLGLLLWILGYVLAMRPSPAMWKFGSLAILVLAGLVGGYSADAYARSQAQGDATSLAEAELGAQNSLILPRDAAARGPVSRRFVAAEQKMAEERRAYNAEYSKLGLAYLDDPYALKQAPDVLDRCGGIAKLKAMAEASSKARAARLGETLAAIDGAQLSGELKTGMKQMLAPGDTPAAIAAMLAADTAYLDGTQAFCTLLARKSWSNQGGVFAFGDAGDRAAYVAIEKRRMDAANKIQILQRDGRDQLIKGRDAVRDILDRAGRS